MTRYVCIHGHFYQPPRENPWLEVIEVQDSATPFHDWNERINRECYSPNSVSRALDEQGRVRRIENNYENISFNIGPTLFSWLETHQPNTYNRIIAADAQARKNRDGHGSAMAQVYNHLIMPLATRKDKETQVRWGIADFVYRFGHQPEGMWLAETAACDETLDVLAQQGITFTLLSQSQAKAVREKGSDQFEPVEGSIDPTRPYRYTTASGREITLFFYDGAISQAVAFERLLENGEKFADRLQGGFSNHRPWDQLLHIATDGETFGHHHHFGEMALTYAINHLMEQPDIELTTYAHYLATHAAEAEVKIHDFSSWSCAHGVERWRSDCGCAIDPGSGYNQQWRKPLRQGLDRVKKELDQIYETIGARFFDDPWATRNRYIEVVIDRTLADSFISREVRPDAINTTTDRSTPLSLLEMQRNSMLMFTSCGWFFDDISGIETSQILRYAARAIQLAGEFSEENIEAELLETLAKARSNGNKYSNGAALYRAEVMPTIVTLSKALANHAVIKAITPESTASLGRVYEVDERSSITERFGENSLTLGEASVRSLITKAEASFMVATLKLGASDVTCFVKKEKSHLDFSNAVRHLRQTWQNEPLIDVIRLLDRLFEKEGTVFQLKDLFVEARRAAVSTLASAHVDRFRETYNDLFWENHQLIDYFIDACVPVPGEFKLAAQYILERELYAAACEIEKTETLDRLAGLMHDIQRWDLSVNLDESKRAIENRLSDMLEQALPNQQTKMIRHAIQILLTAQTAGLELDLWRPQNRLAKAIFGPRNKTREDFLAGPEIRKLGIMLNFSRKTFSQGDNDSAAT